MFKIFSDLCGEYVYDSIKNEVIQISHSLFKNLKQIENKTIDHIIKENESEYLYLHSQGYFNQNEHKISYEINHHIESLLNRMVSRLTIQVTQDCNFRCGYCVFSENDGSNRLHSKQTMEVSKIIETIDFLHRYSLDSTSICIGFYGGEPLLNFKAIKEAMLYAEQKFKGKALSFTITTNATLLNKEMLDFFSNYEISIMISLDGPKKLNDKNRKFNGSSTSTYDIVKEKIKMIHKDYKKILRLISVNMVLDPTQSFRDYQMILSDIPELNDIMIRMNVINEEGLTKHYDFSEDFVQYLEYAKFIRKVKKLGRLNEKIIDRDILSYSVDLEEDRIEQIFSSRDHAIMPSGPCIPGYNKLFVDVNGNLFPCEKISENNKTMNIGDIKNGLDVEKIKPMIEISSLTADECARCWGFRLCMLCLKYSADSTGLSRDIRLRNCNKSLHNATELLYNYVALHRKQLADDKKERENNYYNN